MRIGSRFISVAFLVFAAALVAQAAQRPAARQSPAPAEGSFRPIATVKDLMDDVVIPSSEALFGAVTSVSGPNGIEDKAPQTDEEWGDVRRNALLLAEGGNLLMVGGRRIAGPLDKSANPGSELEPSQIAALVLKDRTGWDRAAQGLIDASLTALKAIEAKNPEALSNAGGEIDEACESCHLRFWYPPQ